MEHQDIFRMTPRKPSRKPWETFPAFAGWAEEQTPKDDPDGLRGVRTAAALAGSVGLLSRSVLFCLDPMNDKEETIRTATGEISRVLHCATVLADEIGFNPIRTLSMDIDSYANRFNQAYGISEEIPYRDRGYFIENIMLRVSQHLLPVIYAHAIDQFTSDGIRREEAGSEILMGVHELQTLTTCYDTTLSACLKRHVHSVMNDKNANTNPER